MHEYDVVIIGSGLGGLACGTILAKEGYSVCVLEKNKQIGGMLQTFARDKVIFDTGVHYVGGLNEGQNLYQFFKYFGIMDKLKLRKMDEDFVDGLIFGEDPTVYKYPQGYDNFIRQMLEYFPDEEKAIRTYCETIQDICKNFPLYNVQAGSYTDSAKAYQTDTQMYLESLTDNKKLQTVLAGTNLLYAGDAYKTPLFVHALIVNHYVESSWKFVDGGSQIARLLAREITSRNGKVIKHVKIVKLKEEDRRIVYAEAEDGTRYYARTFISNVHPLKTVEMTESHMIKNAYRTRLKSLESTISVFYANVVMKKESLPYINSNYYYFAEENAWCGDKYTAENWPRGYALFFTPSSRSPDFAEGVTIMSYMRMEDVSKWKDTFNTVSHEDTRGDDYEAFKREKAEKLFDLVERQFPGFKDSIKSYTCATPLSARDYIGTDDGSLYGYAKDYREPLKTFIAPQTKIPNLLLTGQNINMHGVLGVTISAIMTCSQLIGLENLIQKIKDAQKVS
ncbi:phytoene desaturase family protein [Ohtaekwangia sp.]|uniref:phytoene desaturase family protein n=1 Tax=Ohtaekwangia sp. TaxID=2066019 RepID=UPI002F9256C0